MNITQQDIDILASIGDFAWNTPNATKEDTLPNGAPVICINITDDIMQACIDYVKKDVNTKDENRIIEIINDVKLREQIDAFEREQEIKNSKL